MEYSTPVLDAPAEKKPPGRRGHSEPRRALEHPGPPRRRRRVRGERAARLAAALLVMLVTVAALAPLAVPGDAGRIEPSAGLQAPSASHPFGTDELGRDVLVRTLLGGRITLLTGGAAVTIALLLGGLIGAVAAYRGGWVDALAMALVDVFLAVPLFLVVLLLSTLLRPGIATLCVLVGLTQWMEVARVTRSVVLSVRANEFVEAARALGASDRHILMRHIVQHAMGPVLVTATLVFAQAVLLESAVSFLGFGVPPPQTSWGGMLTGARPFIDSAPWLGVFPGGMIFVTVLCAYTIADHIRDRFAPSAS